MWWFPLSLVLTGALGAPTSTPPPPSPMQIVAVERRGPPPYAVVDRIYCVNGGRGRGLQVGDRLTVKRVGEAGAIGHLRVTAVGSDRSEGHFVPSYSTYPMKGDLVLREEQRPVPEVPRLDAEPLPTLAAPLRATEAPPREGLIFFLPQKGELSLAGLRKLEAWVADWGTGGRWAVQVPTAKALNPALQKERAESLSAALRALGIAHVTIETEPRTVKGKYDPAWIRHWD